MIPPPRLTVAICTHSPERRFLEECLGALRRQTLPISEWCLLVIDNASEPPLADWLDLAWHPAARIIQEPTLGISHARWRALREWRDGELLLFLDDDNVAAPDYLATGLLLSDAHPRLGCWGGQLLAQFEAPPPDWFPPFAKYLAIFPLERDFIADRVGESYDVVPPTAGLFLRRVVADAYLRLVQTDPRHALRHGEDMDLVLSAGDVGLGFGRFKALVLGHIIPAVRLTEAYVERLLEGVRCGMAVVENLRFGRPLPRPIWARPLDCWRAWRLPGRVGRFHRAELRGESAARRVLRSWKPVSLAKPGA